MEPAVLHIPTRVVFGENAVEQLGDVARQIGSSRALLVTDPGVAAVGHAQRAAQSLTKAGVEVQVFDTVHENPTTEDVDACLVAAKKAEIDLFVGIGGGSSIDTARACNFLLTNGGQMSDYWGWGKADKPMLPLITVPTTTGTGSEMQSYALIANAKTHQKMACGDKKAASRAVILDPTLAATQPRWVIACTGLDCIGHALESSVTRKRTPFSRLFAHEAWRLASANFGRILDDPDDLEAQGNMLLAAAYAGLGIEHSMLGAAHSMANPLTAQFDVIHGQAVGMMLPHVVRFNAADELSMAEYAELARIANPATNGSRNADAVDDLIGRLTALLRQARIPNSLTGCGVTPDAVQSLADQAATQWTAQFNPRSLSSDDFRDLYIAAL